MSNDLNRCEFIGRLGADPDLNFTAKGVAVARFSLAVNKRWKDRGSGVQQEDTQWIRIVAFRGLAEVCGQYLSRGSRIFIAGEMKNRTFQDGERERRVTEIIAQEMLMLDSRGSRSATPDTSSPHRSWGQMHPAYKKD
ncbi:MAG: single-stranded DNA-binding protein [Pseudomonadales bacterium]|nr:single-stranded DNA-binding protein [Pseudomonadales bacterium]MBO6595661.1 single-stranded DNA-binding protein [Pseudomonadales bacterium]MBO6702161.1 single-stranded DNA-binding protein [Pseudomonadales bacterium]MBO6820781.1 single-stranded DNA-binding protein [Pseudomonadales bacterium]MBO7007327.1 single-stranded DNA-binding protein [Pseudomonadales bacterium]